MTKRELFIGSSNEALRCAKLLKKKINQKINGQISIDIWKGANWKNLKSILNSIENFKNKYYYAIFIFHPDDFLKSRSKQFLIVRDNVIFELGYFLGQLGADRTFLLIPKIQNQPSNYEEVAIKQLSDLSGSICDYYKINMHRSTTQNDWSYNVTDAANSITKQIKKNEKTLINIHNSSQKENVKAFLESEVAKIKSELIRPNNCDEIYINSFTSNLDLPIRLRTALIGKDIQNTLKDLLIFIKDFEDILDVWQLIQEQTKPNINEVWVFAETPIEYSGAASKESVLKLKTAVLENLYRGVEYIYFISKSCDVSNISNSIIEDIKKKYKRISKKKLSEIKKRIEIRIIDERFFLTYFTLHFRNRNDYDIFLSTLHPERKDLMIKVRDEFKIRIAERIDNLIIHHSIDPNIKIINISGQK